jgi:ribonuclease HI
VEWGRKQENLHWEDLQKTADEMWAVGVAVMLTAIWRRNVDRLHPEGHKEKGIRKAVMVGGAAVNEAYRRYRLGLLPWTVAKASSLRVAGAIAEQCQLMDEVAEEANREQHTRVGFFDGGSRGNPGPGGSGSVFVQLIDGKTRATPTWVAVTALSNRAMTNNVAEFVGLHRLLAHAAVKGWRQIHVVGDSAMILRILSSRTPPKAKRLQYWYQASMRLADICRVESWTHHYRQHNKMADWLVNQAMDSCKSVMMKLTAESTKHTLQQGVAERMRAMWSSGRSERRKGDREEREDEEYQAGCKCQPGMVIRVQLQ